MRCAFPLAWSIRRKFIQIEYKSVNDLIESDVYVSKILVS